MVPRLLLCIAAVLAGSAMGCMAAPAPAPPAPAAPPPRREAAPAPRVQAPPAQLPGHGAPPASPAETAFRAAEERYAAFLAQAPPGPLLIDLKDPLQVAGSKRDIARWNARRVRLLNAAQASYHEVTARQEPAWTVAAIARIGELYHRYTLDITQFPCPGGLAADLCPVFTDQLRRVSEPLRSKAAEAFSHCIRRSEELQVTGPFVELCRRLAGATTRQAPKKP